MQTRVIGIVGGGTMGRGLLHLAVTNGFGCLITNRSDETRRRTRKAFERELAESVERGKIASGDVDAIHERIVWTGDIDEAVAGADLVIETIPEDMAAKKELFAHMGRTADHKTILATNTSSLSVSEIAAASGIPARVIGMHFFHPPVKMKLLEIVVPEATSEVTYREARSVGEALGRRCIRVRDSPGFATSRLSVAVGLEALRMLEEGVAGAEDIDTAMEVGYRWPMGPLKLGDWVGLDVRRAVAEELHDKLGSDTFRVPKILDDLVESGRLGRKTGRGVHRWES